MRDYQPKPMSYWEKLIVGFAVSPIYRDEALGGMLFLIGLHDSEADSKQRGFTQMKEGTLDWVGHHEVYVLHTEFNGQNGSIPEWQEEAWSMLYIGAFDREQKHVVFGKDWVDLFASSKVTRKTKFDDDWVELRRNGDKGVRKELEIKGTEWVDAFTAYVAELDRQQRFNEEKSELLRINTEITLPMLLTAANARDQQEWMVRSNITLIYDTVSEEFEPTDEDIISAIRQVGEDRNNRVLNLSGCQSQACLNALIEVLNARDDIEVLVIANCAMNLRTAQQLLGIVASNTQLRSIDISGNNLPAELEQTFHAITERNMWTMEGDGGLFALTQSHNESLWGAGVLAADEERYGFLEQQNHPAFRAELELPTQEQVRLVRQQPENTIPQAFLCSITHEVMQEPVMDREGHTFERSAIGSWLQGHDTCPISRHRLELADLIPNRALLDAIDEFLSSDSGWR